MIYPYFGVKEIEEPLTHRGSLAFGLASAIHHLGSTSQAFQTRFMSFAVTCHYQPYVSELSRFASIGDLGPQPDVRVLMTVPLSAPPRVGDLIPRLASTVRLRYRQSGACPNSRRSQHRTAPGLLAVCVAI